MSALIGCLGSHDPYFSYVTALLHMNGSNGGTTFPDIKGHIFTAVGSAITSTTIYKFNGSSALFSGASSSIISSSNVDWDFGSGDFTLECWVYSTGSATSAILSRVSTAATYGAFEIYSTGNNIGVLMSLAASGWDLNLLSSGSQFTQNVFHHLAICRNVTNVFCWLDGVSLLTGSGFSGSLYSGGSKPLTIGGTGDGTTPFAGNIAEVRVTKGIARYITAFTPPTSPFPNS